MGDRIVTGGLNDDPKVHSPHHRGIFYGFNRITYGDGKRADTWHCIKNAIGITLYHPRSPLGFQSVTCRLERLRRICVSAQRRK